MKRLFLVLAFLLVFSSAYAKPKAGPPGPVGPQGEQGIQGPIGECEDCCKGAAYGPGLDVIVYETKDKNVGVETQYKYDVNTDSHSIFAVVKVNLWEKLQKK